MTTPVNPAHAEAAAAFGLKNVKAAVAAAEETGIPFWAACALLQKESGGRNVYGHDSGGTFSHDEHASVTAANFFQFLVKVAFQGGRSNGVGPCQITYAGNQGGYFREMADEGLRPWVPRDNMVKGFRIILAHKKAKGTWRAAGTAYNGRDTYGADFVAKCNEWRRRFNLKGTVK